MNWKGGLAIFLSIAIAIAAYFAYLVFAYEVVFLNFKSECALLYKGMRMSGEVVMNRNQDKYMFSVVDHAFGIDLSVSLYEFGDEVKEILEGQCRERKDVKLSKLFFWVKYWFMSKKLGSRETNDGRQCTMYSMNWLFTKLAGKTLTACIREDKYPVYFGVQNKFGDYEFELTFKNHKPGDFPVVIPEICHLPLNVCAPLEPEIQTIEMTRIHNMGDYSLTDENTGDQMGVTFFTCMMVITGNCEEEDCETPSRSSSFSKTVSLYEVSLNTSYGQYALCQNKKCRGGKKGTVGREVSGGGGLHWGGQCEYDEKFGSWYSLYGGKDECKENQKVGDDGCTWKMLEVKKSVSYQCMEDLGFFDACFEDSVVPFSNALKIMKKAFQECPDVRIQ